MLRSTLIFTALFFTNFFLLAQQTPKTLLWRITGNNFPRPCYLYGTMHTEDKRAYYLGDSVYSSLKFCDGFVMEVDPGDLIDTFLLSEESEQIDIAYRQAVENDLINKGPDYYKSRQKEFDSMLTKMKLRFQSLPDRYFRRQEKAYRRRMKNDMRTKLDLYLFDLAKTQGKVVGGVEDLLNRSSQKSKIKVNPKFNGEDFLKSQPGKYADLEEWMIENYADAELDKFIELDTLRFSKNSLSLLLYDRNDKMAGRIDSLGHIRSTFCAVGCSHLPGDSGVIDILRKRGFTVAPVFSSKKIEPGDIKIESQLQPLISISDADSNYTVQMPGKPTWLTAVTRKLSLKTYKELSNEILLMCGVYEDGKTYKTAEKEVEDMKAFFSKYEGMKLYNTKKISRQQLEGYEINFRNHEGYIRMHLFCSNGKTFMFAAGSKNKDSVNSIRCENYMATYQMVLNKPKSETAMIRFECPEKAFNVSMPVLPKKENVQGDITYTNEDVTLFSSIDIKKKVSYMVMIKEPFKGYFPGLDSSLFTQTINEIKKGFRQKYIEEENVQLDGYTALKVKLTGEAENKSQFIYIVMAFRHNRFYSLTARGLALPENEPLFDRYFNSFHFEPYLPARFEIKKGGDNLFSVMAPSPVEILKNKNADSAENKGTADRRSTDYYAFDSSTATSYGVMAFGLGKYYWTEGENSLLGEYARVFFNDSLAVNNTYNNDSLIYNKIVFNGNTRGRELLIKNLQNNSQTRLRIMQYADSVFIINIKGDKELVTNENADTFFTSFRFINENAVSGIFKSKTEKLVKDLQSADSSVWAGAVQALKKGFKFPRRDLQILLNAFLYNYPVPKVQVDISALLAETILPYAGEESSGFIKQHYPLLKSKREDVRMLMFNILAATKNNQAYQLVKHFLLNDPPSPANYDIALSYFSKSPALAITLFPDVSDKIKDPYLGPVILELANMLIDSNKLQYGAIKEYEENITGIAKKMLREYTENSAQSFYLPHTNALLQLLVKMNQKKANGLLNDFTDLRNPDITSVVILAMIKNGQPVPADVIDKFCEAPGMRIALYDELVKTGRQSFFKGRYANQKSFAEAFAIEYTNGQIAESIPKDYDVAAVREEMINGTVARFYIIKINCYYTYENKFYTCITGPFSTDASSFSIKEGKEKYVLYRVKCDAENVDLLFNDFIGKIKK